MANSIDWGKTYCKIHDNNGFGTEQWSTFSIPDFSAPLCWAAEAVTSFTADMISWFGGLLTADTTLFRSDKTQL